MERRVKERLVGAIVLVFLGVWLIPWLLNGQDPGSEPAAPSAEIELPLPPADSRAAAQATARTRTIEIDVARDAGNPVEPADSASDQAPATPATASRKTQAHEPDAGTATAAHATVEHETPAPREAQGLGTAPAPAAGWMVQLGSFGDKGNATRQAERLGTFGYEPRITSYSASGRPMYRVRIGPMETRERAEVAVSALSAHGFVAQIVAPE